MIIAVSASIQARHVQGLASIFIQVLILIASTGLVHSQQSVTPALNGAAKSAGAASQTTEPEEVANGEVIRISANLVSVPVTVSNRDGQYIVGLGRNDFRIYEDGKEQTIVHFSDGNRACSVVLLIDTSGSTAPFLNLIKAAAKAFIEQLGSSDQVRVVYFHGEIKSLTKAATNDRQLLKSAIDEMESGPVLMGTRLYDAVDYALRLPSRETARNAIILFTDGENTWGTATMKSTLHRAEESDAVIYTLQYGDLPPDNYLQRLAAKTGGRYFKADDVNMISQSFAGVAEELRRQYLLGYYPKELGQQQERHIKVKVSRDHVVVRARASYNVGRITPGGE